MRYSTTIAALITGSAAFPHMALQMMEQVEKRQAVDAGESYTGAPTTVFNPQDQFVVNDGDHFYRAPDFSKGDIRGPCPGLNAAANHGYIARNGITNLQEAIEGTNKVFNMGRDLGGFLSAYSVIQAGDPLTQRWSIGGTGNQPLLPILGTPKGLSGTHNNYETDSSPMRGDLYEFGNNFELQLSQFQEFYDYHKGEEDPNYTFDDLLRFRKTRFTQSIERNPNFFYGPFSGIEVSQAAFTFISAFMSNHSAEYPNGFLSRDVLKSFMGITESNDDGRGGGQLQFNPGTERIPDNWYRRSSVIPYSVPLFQLDLLRVVAYDPRTLSVGGNLGKVNSYAGVDLTDLTGGVYNLKNLAEGNNLLCFTKQAAEMLTPDLLQGLTAVLTSAIQSLKVQFLDNLVNGCPELSNIQISNLKQFPGFEADQTASRGLLGRRSELYTDEALAKREAYYENLE